MTRPNGSGQRTIHIGIVGAGKVSDYHHVPALRLEPAARLVAACDKDEALLEQRRRDWQIGLLTTDPDVIMGDPNIDAVIIATPNATHGPLAIAAASAGKHVLCEKPLGLHSREAGEMYRAVKEAGVVHMTAFTYRFAPAMRYLRHLLMNGSLGEPRHFRSQRFLDWPEASWGWRQYRASAGAGNIYDMTIHRIDFAMDLLGPLRRVCGAVARFAPREHTETGSPCAPSEVDDWTAAIGEFECGAVGVWEGTTLAKGYGRGGFGHDWAEVNGSEASAVYRLHDPNRILFGKSGSDLAEVAVPADYLKVATSRRDPAEGEPATVFRYDIVSEFIAAILERRAAVPSFYDGLKAQIVADAILESHEKRAWIELDWPEP